jgi:hypothetical protein
MAFTGDLEDLPIVDVIQLMHSTRNSGILHVNGKRGESQFVFKNGYIVGASHLNNGIRIGDILVAHGAISEAVLQEALGIQHTPGTPRRPLIVTLLDWGMVEEQQAYAALKALIELTLVEVLTWRKGTFTLDAKDEVASDEFKYYPDEIEREINVDVQSILMDALCMFDEKMRDGELTLEEEDTVAEVGITADLLGLDDLDNLERKIPGVYQGLEDTAATTKTESAPPRQVSVVRRLNEFLAVLPELKTATEIADGVLQFTATIFDRALTLVVRPNGLFAEKSIGIAQVREEGIAPALGFELLLKESSLLQQSATSGLFYCGPTDDAVKSQLQDKFGAPTDPTILLLPVKRFGRSIFIVYADFGNEAKAEVPVEILEMMIDQVAEALEYAGV